MSTTRQIVLAAMLSVAAAFQGTCPRWDGQCLHRRRSLASRSPGPLLFCRIDPDLSRFGEVAERGDLNLQLRSLNAAGSESVQGGLRSSSAAGRKGRWTVNERQAFNVSATAANIVTRSTTKSGVQREFNNEIARLGKAGQWQDALEMLQAMEGQGFPPTLVSYNAALSALTKNAQWEQGLEMFEKVFRDCQGNEAKLMKPDSFSYAAALSACAQTRQWQRALALFREMEAAGVEPNVFTYSSLIAACERSEQPAKAAEIFEEMQARGTPGDSCMAVQASAQTMQVLR